MNEDVRLDLEIQNLLDEAMIVNYFEKATLFHRNQKIRTCEQNMEIIVKEEDDSEADYKSSKFKIYKLIHFVSYMKSK